MTESSSHGFSTATVAELAAEYRVRCDGVASALERERIRNGLFREWGGLGYDEIESEFRALAGGLGWPRAATLKDLRHLFATAMNNAGVSEGYRRYLLGHAPGKAASVAYTHLDQIRSHYARAIEVEYAGLVPAVLERMKEVTGSQSRVAAAALNG